MQPEQSSQIFANNFDMTQDSDHETASSPEIVKTMWQETEFKDFEHVDVKHFIVKQQDPKESSKKNVSNVFYCCCI